MCKCKWLPLILDGGDLEQRGSGAAAKAGRDISTQEEIKPGRALQLLTFTLALCASLYRPCGRRGEPAKQNPISPIHLKVSLESGAKLYLRRRQESERDARKPSNPALMTLFLGVLAPQPTGGGRNKYEKRFATWARWDCVLGGWGRLLLSSFPMFWG